MLLSKTDPYLLMQTLKFNPKKDLYELKIQVNDLKPIQRFMRGIEDYEII
jgi:hypothetical protein